MFSLLDRHSCFAADIAFGEKSQPGIREPACTRAVSCDARCGHPSRVGVERFPVRDVYPFVALLSFGSAFAGDAGRCGGEAPAWKTISRCGNHGRIGILDKIHVRNLLPRFTLAASVAEMEMEFRSIRLLFWRHCARCAVLAVSKLAVHGESRLSILKSHFRKSVLDGSSQSIFHPSSPQVRNSGLELDNLLHLSRADHFAARHY